MQFHVDEGLIQAVNVYSDAMDQGTIGELAGRLKGCAYDQQSICRVVETVGSGSREAGAAAGEGSGYGLEGPDLLEQMKNDIMNLVRESL